MGSLDGLHPVFAERLLRLSADVGGLDWNSGHRSSQRQAELYNCWKRGSPGCAPANRPGTSNHEAIPYGQPLALAMDIGRKNRDAARRRASAFGIHFPIAGEPWHCQPVEARSGRYTGMPNFGGAPPPSMVVKLGSRLIKLGSRGTDVAEWQRILRIPSDGIFGPQTDRSTRAFQSANGLAADGIVGPNTLRAARPPAPPPPPPLPPKPVPVPADFRIVGRDEWGAEPPKKELTLQGKPAMELWIHHSVTAVTDDPYQNARKVQEAAFSRGFDDTSYSYLFDPSGVVLEGRGDYVGAHTKGRNPFSKGFCFIGNYSEMQPNELQLEGARRTRLWLIETGRLTADAPIEGHRKNPASPSNCPGDNLYPRIQEIGKAPTGGAVVTPPKPAPKPQPTSPPGDWTQEMIMALPTLRRGSKGQHVRNLQGLLIAAGRTLAVDGDFGPGTDRVLREYQGAARIGVDGIAGPKTWRTLLGA